MQRNTGSREGEIRCVGSRSEAASWTEQSSTCSARRYWEQKVVHVIMIADLGILRPVPVKSVIIDIVVIFRGSHRGGKGLQYVRRGEHRLRIDQQTAVV